MVSQTAVKMHVQYWGVGSLSMTPLPMSTNDISSQLLADWVPTIPAAVSSSFMGWPSLLIEALPIQGKNFLTLRSEVGKTERQWKGFLSWMLGVAGTRHFLEQEGYRWIAPASAFYPNNTHAVDLSSWHLSFPPSTLKVTLPPNPKVRLRPDYLAIRPTATGGVELAVAESKGTSMCLTGKHICPRNWYNQARNINISFRGNILKIPRHIVIATRSHPNAINSLTRRLQVRVWNTNEISSQPDVFKIAAVDIVTAHLFGLFRNLGLSENARALAYSVEARMEEENITRPTERRYESNEFNQTAYSKYVDTVFELNNTPQNKQENVKRLREKADLELDGKGSNLLSTGLRTDAKIEIHSELGAISIEISPETINLASKLSIALTQEEAMGVIAETSNQLDEWAKKQSEKDDDESILKSGVRIRFPKKLLMQ
jgi:hypothetical protein